MKTLKELFKGKKENEEHGQMKSYHELETSKHKHHGHSHGGGEPQSAGKYQCPMKCEGDKTYDKPGNCPVCNMKLVSVPGRESSIHFRCNV